MLKERAIPRTLATCTQTGAWTHVGPDGAVTAQKSYSPHDAEVA